MADKTSGWVVYSGILLVVSGVASILDGIWAFRYDESIADLVFFEGNIQAWGWIWLLVGILLVAAGFGALNGASWARIVGIVFASIALLTNLSWASIQPTQGLIGALLAALVIYGLAAHGDQVAA